jgi:hypothetical protein
MATFSKTRKGRKERKKERKGGQIKKEGQDV